MSAARSPEPAVARAAEPAAARPLRVLFFMEYLGRYLRFFDSVIRELLERGHAVHLVFEREQAAPRPLEQVWLRRMEKHPGFRWSHSAAWRRDPWFRVARPVRGALDYVYFLQLGEERVPYLLQRARRRAPRTFKAILHVPGMTSDRALRAWSRILDVCDRAVPASKGVQRLVRREEPDVVLVTPHLMPSSTDAQYAKSAAAAGVPTGVCIASWDNLSSKQLLRVVPDLLTVWNDVQRREAVSIHDVPDDRVVSTGAQCFDHWFGWPPRPRAEFCARVGLDPSKPYVLYVGGSLFPSTMTEAEYCVGWIRAVRASDEPALRDAGILIRPHPHRTAEWREIDFGVFEDVVVWPPNVVMPTEQDTRADYFDSIYHSAVVFGINTSAMIEAGIIGKAVHTITVPQFAASQGGVLHFRYLREVGGGLVQVSETLEENVRRLGEVVAGRDTEGEEAARRFTELFVRPNGVQVPATPVFVDAVEELAERGPRERAADSRWLVLLRPPLALIQVPFLLLRVRLKAALELRRLAARLGLPVAPAAAPKPAPAPARPEDE
ncbi:MAG TPA: hypothetical protein VFB35_03135 [Gaiellaceae bacterium]|nr:hypothetical protein [Gaiellaceae bacterium]